MILTIIQNMPEADQDYVLREAMGKTVLEGESDPVAIEQFSGKISEWVALGAQAIGHQLGDFSYFLRQIDESTAETKEKEKS